MQSFVEVRNIIKISRTKSITRMEKIRNKEGLEEIWRLDDLID
jgi:hypothetical protein